MTLFWFPQISKFHSIKNLALKNYFSKIVIKMSPYTLSIKKKILILCFDKDPLSLKLTNSPFRNLLPGHWVNSQWATVFENIPVQSTFDSKYILKKFSPWPEFYVYKDVRRLKHVRVHLYLSRVMKYIANDLMCKYA